MEMREEHQILVICLFFLLQCACDVLVGAVIVGAGCGFTVLVVVEECVLWGGACIVGGGVFIVGAGRGFTAHCCCYHILGLF